MAAVMRVTFLLAFALLWAIGPAQAAGGSEPSGPDLSRAEGLIKSGKYADAVAELEKADSRNPRNADILNYLGYSHRQLGDYERAMTYYEAALKVDPRHRGANEYMGELYLQLGQLDKAEERLDVLDGACFFGCEEYSELKKAIEDYKAKNGAS